MDAKRLKKISFIRKKGKIERSADAAVTEDVIDRQKILDDIHMVKEELHRTERECSANIRASAFAGKYMIPGIDHLMVCFDDGSFLGSRNPFAVMKRSADGWGFVFITAGRPGAGQNKSVVTELTFTQFLELARERGHTEDHLVPVPMPERLSSRDNIERRINAAMDTRCTLENSEDFCFWCLTGLRKGFFTTGDFLEIVI
ncbi:MAG TPA: hypothetical protein PLU72_11465 [Candidatus Ozemobacteraceae bacterium]|nr:hypothetical protein [Candidatus Ozemobacteraceae bacterium]